jgi:hypothetical protein
VTTDVDLAVVVDNHLLRLLFGVIPVLISAGVVAIKAAAVTTLVVVDVDVDVDAAALTVLKQHTKEVKNSGNAAGPR